MKINSVATLVMRMWWQQLIQSKGKVIFWVWNVWFGLFFTGNIISRKKNKNVLTQDNLNFMIPHLSRSLLPQHLLYLTAGGSIVAHYVALLIANDLVYRPHDCVRHCTSLRTLLDLLLQAMVFLFCPSWAGQVWSWYSAKVQQHESTHTFGFLAVSVFSVTDWIEAFLLHFSWVSFSMVNTEFYYFTRLTAVDRRCSPSWKLT